MRTTITPAFEARMVREYAPRLGSEEAVRVEIEDAKNHKAMSKRTDLRKYLQTWLRRQALWREERRARYAVKPAPSAVDQLRADSRFPPAFTEYVGRSLLAAVSGRAE